MTQQHQQHQVASCLHLPTLSTSTYSAIPLSCTQNTDHLVSPHSPMNMAANPFTMIVKPSSSIKDRITSSQPDWYFDTSLCDTLQATGLCRLSANSCPLSSCTVSIDFLQPSLSSELAHSSQNLFSVSICGLEPVPSCGSSFLYSFSSIISLQFWMGSSFGLSSNLSCFMKAHLRWMKTGKQQIKKKPKTAPLSSMIDLMLARAKAILIENPRMPIMQRISDLLMVPTLDS